LGWAPMSKTRPSARSMDIEFRERLGTGTGYKAGRHRSAGLKIFNGGGY
jgi:hypothetical protein